MHVGIEIVAVITAAVEEPQRVAVVVEIDAIVGPSSPRPRHREHQPQRAQVPWFDVDRGSPPSANPHGEHQDRQKEPELSRGRRADLPTARGRPTFARRAALSVRRPVAVGRVIGGGRRRRHHAAAARVDPVTVLVDPIAADLGGARKPSRAPVIAVVAAERRRAMAVAVSVRLGRTRSVRPAAILVDAITTGIDGRGVHQRILVVAVAAVEALGIETVG